MTPLTVSVVDECIAIEVGDDRCLGIVTRPTAAAETGVLLLPARDCSFGGRTRFVHRLTQQLALDGARVLRFDYLGTGESDGGLTRMRANAPNTDEVVAAARALLALGHHRIVVVGYCYGARAILDALDQLPEIGALVLIAPPVRPAERHVLSVGRALRKLTQPTRWADLLRPERRRKILRKARRAVQQSFGRPSTPDAPGTDQSEAPEPTVAGLAPAFVDGIARVAARGLPTLLIYGSGDGEIAAITAAAVPDLDRILEPGASPIELRVLPGSIHAHLTLDDATIDAAAVWVHERTIDGRR
jgi:pimeloyl-ACP methyl ester carboxylesterase